MPKYNQALNEKHWKALQLIEAGVLSLKSIAEQCGWSADYMYDLYEGEAKVGKIGELFKTELRKLEKKNTDKIKTLTKENKSLALRLMNDFLRRKATAEYLSDDDSKLVCGVFNAIAKASPNVEINSSSWSYTKGLTSEELVHEFNKLRSLAEGAPKRRGVPEAGQGRAGVLSALAKSGSGSDEESEAS